MLSVANQTGPHLLRFPSNSGLVVAMFTCLLSPVGSLGPHRRIVPRRCGCHRHVADIVRLLTRATLLEQRPLLGHSLAARGLLPARGSAATLGCLAVHLSRGPTGLCSGGHDRTIGLDRVGARVDLAAAERVAVACARCCACHRRAATVAAVVPILVTLPVPRFLARAPMESTPSIPRVRTLCLTRRVGRERRER